MSVICIDNSDTQSVPEVSGSTSADAPPRRVTGFALPGYASRAANKNIALGSQRRWTADEARQHGAAGGRIRSERLTADERSAIARQGALVTNARRKALP